MEAAPGAEAFAAHPEFAVRAKKKPPGFFPGGLEVSFLVKA